jgi:homoaconitate hydratase family protein
LGQTIIQKILAKSAGLESVVPGQIIDAQVNTAMIHDNTGPVVIEHFHKLPKRKVWDPEKIVITFDHHPTNTNMSVAENHLMIKKFAEEFNIKYTYSGGDGISHTLLAENKHILPGQVLVGTDSHTNALGALGCFATGIGATEMVGVFVRGKLWFNVPVTVKIEVNGVPPFGVEVKDLALKIISLFGPQGVNYKAVEFTGESIERLSIPERLTLCAMSTEMGAKCAVVPADEKTAYYLGMELTDFAPYRSDEDARYEGIVHIDLSGLCPQVAVPDLPTNATDISNLSGENIRIDQATISSCAGGNLYDLEIAAKVVKGRKVAKGVRFYVVPASKRILEEAVDKGIITALLEAGAVIGVPGCGTCGAHYIGSLAKDEVCISSTTRNMKGRMGAGGKIYLAGSATVAASAVTGKLTDPRELLEGRI